MTIWTNIITILVLFAIFIIFYSKIKDVTIKEALDEIAELFKFDGGKK